jgi:hypothetical protein
MESEAIFILLAFDWICLKHKESWKRFSYVYSEPLVTDGLAAVKIRPRLECLLYLFKFL